MVRYDIEELCSRLGGEEGTRSSTEAAGTGAALRGPMYRQRETSTSPI